MIVQVHVLARTNASFELSISAKLPFTISISFSVDSGSIVKHPLLCNRRDEATIPLSTDTKCSVLSSKKSKKHVDKISNVYESLAENEFNSLAFLNISQLL